MARSVLLVLCGLPGAGKSTLVRELLASSLRERPHRVTVVSYDEVETELRQSLFARRGPAEGAAAFSSELWHLARSLALQRCEQVLAAAEPPDNSPLVVIVDDNMYYRSMRSRLAQLARQQRASFAVCFVDTPLEECLRRNASRPAPVAEEVIRRMAARMEPPDGRQCHWEQHSIVVTPSTPLAIAAVWGCVSLARAAGPAVLPPAAATREGPTPASTSALHKLDLALRATMSRLLAEHTELRDASKSRTVNAMRREVLAAAGSALLEVEVGDAPPAPAVSLHMDVEGFRSLFCSRVESLLLHQPGS